MPLSSKHNRSFCVACGETNKCNQLNNKLMFAMMADRMFESNNENGRASVLEHWPLCVCIEEKRCHYYVEWCERGLRCGRLASGTVFRKYISSSRVYVIAAAKCFNINNDGVKCELFVFGFCAFIYIRLIKRPTMRN